MQDSEPTPITQDTQTELDNLLKKLDDLPKSEKTTELANNLIIAKNLGFEGTAKAMIEHVRQELEKIPTEETPKINNNSPISDSKILTTMIKKQNNTKFFEDLDLQISKLDSSNNFYKSYLDIVEKMQDWLKDNIPQDDEKYKDINTYLNLTKNGQIKNKQKHLQQTLAAMKNTNEQNLNQGQSK